MFRTLEGAARAGLNRVQWDLRGEEPDEGEGQGGFGGGRGAPRAEPGIYGVKLTVDGEELSATVRVLEDTWMQER